VSAVADADHDSGFGGCFRALEVKGKGHKQLLRREDKENCGWGSLWGTFYLSCFEGDRTGLNS
jgi:hypothetical protein